MNSPQTEAAAQTLVTLYKEASLAVTSSAARGSTSAVSTGFRCRYAMYLDGPWATTTYREDKFTGDGNLVHPKGVEARPPSSVEKTSS